MKFSYGIAVYDSLVDQVSYYKTLPIEESSEGSNLAKFLEAAGAKGWELCASFQAGADGDNVAVAGGGLRKRKYGHELQILTFKRRIAG